MPPTVAHGIVIWAREVALGIERVHQPLGLPPKPQDVSVEIDRPPVTRLKVAYVVIGKEWVVVERIGLAVEVYTLAVDELLHEMARPLGVARRVAS